ncbi:MAG: superoxide dismutase family protein [Candidatus Marinimicrobia bacterium]|jgi:Cu-Zn family superoxide dismutase|nr:superoxide dismutase family protein [Candidatus Neomarinimicrobiota bacterium]MBT3675764.1 superoxide dismutase family protein [Candidatus Neomarinimicrobiota bacterium]MBT4067954.1 superoxide dismutase family protein [Candidatus Neomarinimicrobiota bacterium]MBT4308285.1 superoxide dismutase family protein [Candidatus Neomarinimicrobiota bacterium]MBT5176123.1 superoxide dismutase family protein [Candidatus Neomarinimicrobiota bacterium]
MKNIYITLTFIALIACSSPNDKTATANILPRSGSSVTGEVVFTERKGIVSVEANIFGVGAGPVAVHIHTIGDCSSDDGKSSGGHWNPTEENHGKWGVAPFHSGDIGNIKIDDRGKGKISITDKSGRWSIGGSPETDIIGKAIVVHVGMDDMASQPTGAAGARIGCGVIKKRFTKN